MQPVLKAASRLMTAAGFVAITAFTGAACLELAKREAEKQAAPPCQAALQQFGQLATAYAATMLPGAAGGFARLAARTAVEAGVAEV